MASASRVAEIFEQAATAFGRLAQLTLNLKQQQAQQTEGESKTTSKWSQKEIDLLKDAVTRFGTDLAKISESIESKTLNQIKQKLKSKAFQDAGLGESSTGEDHDVQAKISASNPPAAMPTGRRKQTLDEISDGTELSSAKRRKIIPLDQDEFADYDPEDAYDANGENTDDVGTNANLTYSKIKPNLDPEASRPSNLNFRTSDKYDIPKSQVSSLRFDSATLDVGSNISSNKSSSKINTCSSSKSSVTIRDSKYEDYEDSEDEDDEPPDDYSDNDDDEEEDEDEDAH